MPSLAILPEEDDSEPFLIMALLPAMAEGRNIQIEGAVSKKLLSNLSEFRDIWHSWNPGYFKKIEFASSQILAHSNIAGREGAVAAFSGGVDSTFTVWRHKSSTAGQGAQLIRYCIFVHGFDIPLWKEEEFRRIFSHCEQTLQTLDLVLFPVRTNCRTVFTQNWEIWHGAAVAACLQLFKGECEVGLIASTFDSRQLTFPWGSNPLTDPLLATDSFDIIHDGIAFPRSKKIAAVKEWQAGYNGLRVCFYGIEKGIIKDGNCGKCPRCVITLLRIQFAGLPIPESFPGPPSAKDILRLRPSGFYAHFWRILLREALIKHQRFSLVLAIAWISFSSCLASILKRMLQAAGIWEPSF